MHETAPVSTPSRSPLLDQYDRDGYCIARDVLDADLIGEIREHIFWLHRKHPDLAPEDLSYLLVRDEPLFLRTVSDPRLLDIAEQFIGPDIALFATGYLPKPPGYPKPILWHQDGSYWPLDPVEVATLWIAISDSTPANGCMRVIPGTHTLPLLPQVDRPDVDSVLGTSLDPSVIDESRAIDIVLRAGDVSMHHPNVIHGSNPNSSATDWRLTQLIRYIPTHVRITQPNWPCAFGPFRGSAAPGVNDYLPMPKYVPGRHMPFRGCEAWA
jgi:ectoine hydroxylase-related dioxygenase (phytanoyl-CoA dioxygenase family)